MTIELLTSAGNKVYCSIKLTEYATTGSKQLCTPCSAANNLFTILFCFHIYYQNITDEIASLVFFFFFI